MNAANDETNQLTEEEIRRLIANQLPRLITQNPEIRYELIGVMSETFAKKDWNGTLYPQFRYHSITPRIAELLYETFNSHC